MVVADGARSDFAAILDELDFVKWQLARLPTHAHFSRTLLIATASQLALIVAIGSAVAMRTMAIWRDWPATMRIQ